MLDLTYSYGGSASYKATAPIQGWVVKAKFTKDNNTDAVARFMTCMDATKISVTRYVSSEGVPMIDQLKLSDVAEFNAADHGFVRLALTNNDEYTAHFNVMLSRAGNLPLHSDDLVKLLLEGLHAGTTSIEFHSIIAPVTDDLPRLISAKEITAGAAMSLDVRATEIIAVPSTVTKLVLRNVSGITQELSAAELEMLAPLHNEFVYNFDGKMITLNRFRFLAIPTAYQASVTISSTGNVYTFRNERMG